MYNKLKWHTPEDQKHLIQLHKKILVDAEKQNMLTPEGLEALNIGDYSSIYANQFTGPGQNFAKARFKK